MQYYYVFLEPELVSLQKRVGARLTLHANSPDQNLAEEHLTERLIPPDGLVILEDQQSDVIAGGNSDLKRSLLRLYQVILNFASRNGVLRYLFRD